MARGRKASTDWQIGSPRCTLDNLIARLRYGTAGNSFPPD
jgi:hypothetical protein